MSRDPWPKIPQHFKSKLLDNGVLILGFNTKDKPVNVLSFEAIHELKSEVIEVFTNPNIKACVLVSLKAGNFIAGADIKELQAITNIDECRNFITLVHQIFKEIEDCKKPFVAAIEGACFGGGLELALAFDYRVASDHPKTVLGLPEVMLGIIPGFGGTQRLPKLIGFVEALKLITTGKSVYTYSARKLGLIDDLVPHVNSFEKSIDNIDKEPFVAVAIQRALELIISNKKRSKFYIHRKYNPLSIAIRNIISVLAKRQIKKRVKNYYPAPIYALQAIRRGLNRDAQEASIKYEMPRLLELIASPTAKNLMNVFLASQEMGKASRPQTPLLPPRDAIGVFGAGLMGSQIASNLSQSGFRVNLKDIQPEFLTTGLNRILGEEKNNLSRRRIAKKVFEERLLRINPVLDWSSFANTPFVIEAVKEVLETKQSLLAQFEKVASPNAIFATNTSSFMVSEIAQNAKNKERCIAMHFFNPLKAMRLVEIGVADFTSPEVIARTVQLAKSMGKVPLIVKDSPGFLINRILLRYMIEATIMIAEGMEIDKIDSAAKNFGMAIDSGRTMGPLELIDYVGIGTAEHVIESLKKLGPRVEKPDPNFIDDMVSGKLSFWKDGRPNKELSDLLKTKYGIGPKTISEHELTERLILPMIDESVRCILEGIVREPRHLDTAMVLATGFPAFRGGPLKWLSTEGVIKVHARLINAYRNNGKRFSPVKNFLDILNII